MLDVLLKRFRRLHMVGIGGSGMSGIAEVLLGDGFRVTGSDQSRSDVTDRLVKLGAEVFIGHNSSYVGDAAAVVYSSAIRQDNVELEAARQKKIPLIPRAEMLAELMRMKAGVAISGTHGKTTTTSLTGAVLTAGNLDPMVIVGGRLRRIEGGVRQGAGAILVAEADEFDQSFLRLTPTLVVITNIDEDHIECYGSFNALEDAFVSFGNSVPFYGRTIVCIDEPSIQSVLSRFNRPVLPYGISSQAEVRGREIVYNAATTEFDIECGGQKLGRVHLPLPGRHNVLNALAATAVGIEFGLEFTQIKEALAEFEGVHRRFEIVAEIDGVMIVDDFAHHPAEISATLAAAKSGWNRPLIAIFQPHLFSRTQSLAKEFGRALLAAESAIVLPIYPAREQPIEGVNHRLIVEAAREMGHKNIIGLDDRSDVTQTVKSIVKSGDMVLTIGAGDVYKLAPMIVEGLKS